MSVSLILLRHAKSDWNQPLPDFDRPLNNRGRKAIGLVGRHMHKQGLNVDHVCSSPAERAAQTATGISKYLQYPEAAIHWEQRLYHASLETLLQVVAELSAQHARIMLVGHNPGLEELLCYLVPESRLPEHYKLLPTAAYACLEIPENRGEPAQGTAELKAIVLPRKLEA